jgi:hypothetical protein
MIEKRQKMKVEYFCYTSSCDNEDRWANGTYLGTGVGATYRQGTGYHPYTTILIIDERGKIVEKEVHEVRFIKETE